MYFFFINNFFIGIHSGDATLVTPPQDLSETTILKITKIVKSIALHFQATGPLNMQLIAKVKIHSYLNLNKYFLYIE